MSTVPTPPVWLTRLLRVGAAIAAAAALSLWVTPVNAGGPNLTSFGCGSPASPRSSALVDFVCSDHLGGAKASVVALALAAALLLVISELVLVRIRATRTVLGAAAVAVVAVPVFALATASLFTTVAREGADGALIRCGTPLTPATDAISSRLCGQLPARSKGLALTSMGLALLAIAGGGYVASGGHAVGGPRSPEPGEEAPPPDGEAPTPPGRVDEQGQAGRPEREERT